MATAQIPVRLTIDPVQGGEAIRCARRACGLTQPELGKRCGVTKATVSSWETGTYRPSIEYAAALRHTLGLTIEQVYGIEYNWGAA